MAQDGENSIEKQRLKNLENGSEEDYYESSGDEESDGDNHEDNDDQPTRFEAVHRSGRRVIRLCFNKLRKNPSPFQSQNLLKLHVFFSGLFQMHIFYLFIHTVKSSVKKIIIKATLFYKIAVWEPD